MKQKRIQELIAAVADADETQAHAVVAAQGAYAGCLESG
jgi:hypothetical protein